jgi:hypothetical protein
MPEATDRPLPIPLRRRDGTIRAYALIDREDAHLAVYRWHFKTGYAVRDLRRGSYRWAEYLHRLVLRLPSGDLRQGDHVNGDTLDNRRSNLRVVTRAQNMQNVSGVLASSRYRGVSWHRQRQKWQANATLIIDGRKKQHYLGLFTSEEEAAAVASAFRAEHMPFTNEDRLGVAA